MSLSVFPNLSDDSKADDLFFMQMRDPLSSAVFSIAPTVQSPADFAEFSFGGFDGDIAPPSLSGKYENSEFSAIMQVTGVYPVSETETGSVIINNIELLGYSVSCNGFTAEKVAGTNTIRVSGKAVQVFTDEIYEFLMPDLKTIKSLPGNTSETYSALVKWRPPSIKEVAIQHKFTVIINYVEQSTLIPSTNRTAIISLSIPQTIRWNYTTSVAQFRNSLSKGTI